VQFALFGNSTGGNPPDEPPPPPTGGADCTVQYSITSDWGNGFNGFVLVTAPSYSPTADWTAEFKITAGTVQPNDIFEAIVVQSYANRTGAIVRKQYDKQPGFGFTVRDVTAATSRQVACGVRFNGDVCNGVPYCPNQGPGYECVEYDRDTCLEKKGNCQYANGLCHAESCLSLNEADCTAAKTRCLWTVNNGCRLSPCIGIDKTSCQVGLNRERCFWQTDPTPKRCVVERCYKLTLAQCNNLPTRCLWSLGSCQRHSCLDLTFNQCINSPGACSWTGTRCIRA